MALILTSAERMVRLTHEDCPFRLGQRVSVNPASQYGGDWPGVYIVTGVRWDYQRGATGREINISIASEDEIVRRDGDTDGWSPDDLSPA